MTLKEVLDSCKDLKLSEKRSVSDDYSELVFYSRDVVEWDKALTQALGAAVKPAGREPSPGDSSLAKEYGGIHKNQTLYKKDFDSGTVMAMFWPWQDNAHTTLKLVKK